LSGEPQAGIRIRPVGDAALTVELGDVIEPATNARVRALDRALQERPFPGFVESVPTHRSLLVCFDPERCPLDDAAAALGEAESRAVVRDEQGRLHVMPVRYGHEDGPDLDRVARHTGITPAEVVAYHASRDYTAFMLGFLPGFAYLGLLPEALGTPRQETPRPRVPAGSVAIAGRLTAIYPSATPGGWNILGRSAVRLFEPQHDPPTLLAPGDRVRFRPVMELDPVAEAAESPPAVANPSILVEAPGLLTTVQAAPRHRYRRFGVAGGGPLDADAHARANRAVGNPDVAAALECTVAGPTLRFLKPTTFAIGGADLGARLERADLGPWAVPAEVGVLARPGNVLSFEGRRSGCRAYVAFAAGIDVPSVLGSGSTDLHGRFGGFRGRALAAGDELALVRAAAAPHPRERTATRSRPTSDEVTVRVIPGPQEDLFAAEAMETLLTSTFSVTATSDRVGVRLEGPRLVHGGATEIASDGMVPGVIQVPADGQPILMLADGPTTGGYPKIATVVEADLGLLAQLLPGVGRVRFRTVP
jgi:KipI family sensor histidine kinase inhibitor